MAKYSVELRTYIDYHSQDEMLSTRDRIEKGRTKLFDFDYPLFDPNYKKVFETHFIRKFYMREVGSETIGLFKFQLETWLLVNMPYFNKLFESELIDFNPLENSKVSATHTKTTDKTQTSTTDGTVNSTSNGTVTEDNFDRQLDSNNPDSRLTITTNDGQGVIEYASNISENNENNSQETESESDETSHVTNDSEVNETEDYIQSRAGKIGVQTYSKMLDEYRQSFIRIENKIFDEMQELFMLVY